MDNQALTLNNTIEKVNTNVLEMLSERGKNIFFPKLGILAQSAQAKGKKINATIGEAVEDDGSSMHLPEFDALLNMPTATIFPYAPSFGKPELRTLWKDSIYRKNPSLKDTVISNPIATNGLTHGISMAGYLFADEGDTVLLSNHYWENYNLIFENNYGAKVSTFELFDNGGFNVADFAKQLNNIEGEKIITLLNFPNNPSGYTPLTSEIKAIVAEIKKVADKGKKVVVLIDDAYFGLVYEEGVFTESIFVELANLSENVLAVKMDGATKEDYVWGFRVGFISYAIKGGTAELYEALENKTAGAVRGNISNISQLSQSLLYKVYSAPSYDESKKKKFEILKGRYQVLRAEISKAQYADYFAALPFNSGYFMCIELKKGLQAEEVRKHLLAEYSTGVIVLGNVIRLAFSAVPQSQLPQLVENLYKACVDLDTKSKA
ncbi:MAG: aminotransferase class I/II-fold pyridoxal phosphate-dependent enzyme [Bacteroidales bacterium]|jgi:aspartate/methionine/tyrosine aminotransferase|nr:aminotransferase class I/II-fold pyridoxal phosphate-dependent enzyme [Bacteroidales bacterium]